MRCRSKEETEQRMASRCVQAIAIPDYYPNIPKPSNGILIIIFNASTQTKTWASASRLNTTSTSTATAPHEVGLINNSYNMTHGLRKRRRSASTSTCCSTSQTGTETEDLVDENGEGSYLARDYYGWKVRRMVQDQREMRKVAFVQAQAFHEPVLVLDHLFFQFFQAEVLSALLYRLRNSPPERYACLVAEAEASSRNAGELVGVVDATVLRDEGVLENLPAGAQEYLYVSGIAVLNNFRRKKVGSALLEAIEKLSSKWGIEHLVLRAYEDDKGALKLYGKAGYRVVGGDPPWMTTWIGRKRRVLMIKRPNYLLI